ncbi:Peptidoglycan-binding LysM [Desulfuromonas acetoxidans DSM 684]|uniref:Peptidoglycan-binding LysM n=2 Tax=Desulfuromonas acetoxidans TaxID=891 RepID=Q1K220_DESA6|nr:Peptidoglycan-binding LysM [Desulfuromonas acetoxidans DSM 684]
MRMNKLIILACLLLLPAVAIAQDNPRIYTIQKGDTLWGISKRFITDPWYWPNLWANNPFIRNPHLIYPGQKLAIYDGRIELLPEYPQDEPVVEEPTAEPLPEPVEEITFTTAGDLNSFISNDRLENVGRLVDTVDNRIMMTQGDTVFLQMSDEQAAIGNKYQIFKLADPVIHPQTGANLGFQIIYRGALQLTAAHEQVYSGTISKAVNEIERGDILLPVTEHSSTIVLKRAETPLEGCIIAANPEKMALGQRDIFYIDLGTTDGLEVGNMMTIVRPRQATELALQDRNIVLPDTLLGRALVVKTDAESSAAVILKSAEPIYRGDLVYTEME